MGSRAEEMLEQLLEEVQELKSMLGDHMDSHEEGSEELADDEFSLEDPDQINEALQCGVYELVWNSSNGEKVMMVTLDADEVPDYEHHTLEDVVDSNSGNEQLKVWSTDRDGWRSFWVADIISMTPLE